MKQTDNHDVASRAAYDVLVAIPLKKTKMLEKTIGETIKNDSPKPMSISQVWISDRSQYVYIYIHLW